MDMHSKDNIERLKSDLNSLHMTLSDNIDLLLDREKNLNSYGSNKNFLIWRAS